MLGKDVFEAEACWQGRLEACWMKLDSRNSRNSLPETLKIRFQIANLDFAGFREVEA